METNPNIEKDIERTMGVFKSIRIVDAPAMFTEKAMQRIGSAKQQSRFTTSVLLKIAAAIILICINAYTINYIFDTPVQQTPAVTTTIDDLVNDYQVADMNNDWLNNKTIKNEQTHELPEAH
ncbi:MAG TPA: hypothetical protein VK890_02150 [Bacteroidia bacterium]|jgi:hypothetical protein|nr:hypothetical protein [Bacteroidia bacterium]